MNKKHKEKVDYEVSSGNVFADLGLEHPEELLARSNLLDQIGDLIKKSGLTQSEVAKKLGITQPKVSMLVGGRLSAFSTETLFHYLSILGCNVEIHVTKPIYNTEIFRARGRVAVC